ncbi:MAG: HD domain-containing protein [Candidatus Thorarchaeota archaeon]|nr:MAG: HD domain-containing protein [Candidatus Thorarchaeota archaeon]
MAKSPRQRNTLKDRVRRAFKHNELCIIAFDALESDIEVQTVLEDSNRMAIDRMGYSDHGHIHSLIVSLNGIKLLRELGKGIQTSIVKEDTGTIKDSELVVLLGCYLHDIGMVVGRPNHDEFSVIIAMPILDRILAKVYPKDRHKQVHIRGHVMHAIYCHDKVAVPMTVEAGVVGIADALDMTKGRARIPFEAGSVNIHSASAMAIEHVKIRKGELKTVRIDVTMNNASGIFQIQELLEEKIRNAKSLIDHIELYAIMSPMEDKIIEEELRVL